MIFTVFGDIFGDFKKPGKCYFFKIYSIGKMAEAGVVIFYDTLKAAQ
jgi:hypothetical protein